MRCHTRSSITTQVNVHQWLNALIAAIQRRIRRKRTNGILYCARLVTAPIPANWQIAVVVTSVDIVNGASDGPWAVGSAVEWIKANLLVPKRESASSSE